MENSFIGPISVAYYSGTGTTERVARLLSDRLEAAGSPVQRLRIRAGADLSCHPHNRLVLVFAVHAFNAPEIVYQWLDRLPTVEGTPALVLSVSAGGEVYPNRACRCGAISRLERKGYQVDYEDMIVMPSNWVVPTPEPLALMLLDVLPAKLDRMVRDLEQGICKRAKPGWIDRFTSWCGKMEKVGARAFGRKIRVSEACTGCGLCARNCPADNIRMLTGLPSSRPLFGKECHLCLSCLYGCPTKALTPGIGKFVVIREGFTLSSLMKKLPPPTSCDVHAIAKGYLWSGVRKYFADMNAPHD